MAVDNQSQAHNTITVVSELDGKRCKLVIKSGLRGLTVANIKKHVAAPTGVAIPDQVLSYNGVVLQDYQTGEQIGLTAGAQLRLSTISQGPPPPADVASYERSQPLPPPPAGLPASAHLSAVDGGGHAHAQYYTPSESSLGAGTHQVSTVAASSHPSAPAAALPHPDASWRAPHEQPDTLRPDLTGRERQQEAELTHLKRRSDELTHERSLANQGHHSQALPPPPPGAPQSRLSVAAHGHPPGLPMPQSPRDRMLPPNPSLVDPSVAGYNDLPAVQERLALERQAAVQDQIDQERGRYDDMNTNTSERALRQERMIKGSRREQALLEQNMALEQRVQSLEKDLATLSSKAMHEEADYRARAEAAEARAAAAEAELHRKAAEADVLAQRLAEAELALAKQPPLPPPPPSSTVAAAAALPGSITGLALARASLAEFGRDIGVGDQLDFDENLTCVVGLEQRYTILLAYDAKTERLYVYSTLLSYLPDDAGTQLRLYETLLEGALLGREMCGGGVGLSLKNKLLLLSTSIDLRHSDPHALKDVVPGFVDCLVRWRQAVKETLQPSSVTQGGAAAAAAAALNQPP